MDKVNEKMKYLFRHRRHKWKLDSLSEWLLLLGVAIEKDLYRADAQKTCIKCGKKEPLMKGSLWA